MSRKARVGGLLGRPLVYKGNASDVNTTLDTGYYGVNKDGGITSNAPYGYGTLIVLRCDENSAGGGSPVVQVLVGNTAWDVFIRSRWSGSWSDWRKISVQQV